MRWQVVYTTALSVCWTTTNAFTPMVVRRSSTTRRHVGGSSGWDNDNFLESLSGGPQDRKEANDQYYRQARFGRPTGDPDTSSSSSVGPDDDDDLSEGLTKGAALTPEMIAKIKASHTPEEEASQGGKMFKELLAKAQRGGGVRPPPELAAPVIPPPMVPPPQLSLENMSVEQQAALFRQMMMQQQQQQQQPPPMYAPPPPTKPASTGPRNAYPPQGITLGEDGKRPGRNKDADMIVNTSDVYLARLKRDSTNRNYARYSGDDDLANTPFYDPAIQEIKLHVNPYMEEARQKERELYDTVPEEMIDPSVFVQDEKVDPSYAGISYKARLEQRRSKTTITTTVASTTTSPAPAAPVAATPAPAPPVAAATAPPAPVAPQAIVAPPAAAAPMVSTPPTASGDFKQDTRTLMGLLLKHRGGPGFGSGRLKGAEMERFDKLSNEMVRLLRQEALGNSEESSVLAQDLQVGQRASAVVVPSSQQQQQPATASFGNAADTQQRADAMIACIEGAVLMYKNSPPELRESVMVTLRAALVSAVTTCNNLMPGRDEQAVLPAAARSAVSSLPMDVAGIQQRIDSMMALLEGAVLMYKNSPLELRESVLVTLRAALLSAVATCNQLIANNEVENVKAYQAATVTRTTTSPNTPVAGTASSLPVSATPPPVVTPVESVAAVVPKVYSGNDENSVLLESIYDKLVNAAGDGKMGLRNDLSPQEAKQLIMELTDMRMLLLDELETGIPDTTSTEEEEQQGAASGTGSQSNYLELLAKARAVKDAKQ